MVISNRPEARGIEAARSRGLPDAVLPSLGVAREAYDRCVVAELRRHRVDLVCLALEGKASRLNVPVEQLGPAADLAPYAAKPADFRVPGQPSS